MSRPEQVLTYDALNILTPDETEALLLELVAHPGGVAAALHLLGYKGTRRIACGCPVYRYLRAHGYLYKVGQGKVCLDGTGNSESRWVWVRMPSPVSYFVIDFDAGKYPELEAA